MFLIIRCPGNNSFCTVCQFFSIDRITRLHKFCEDVLASSISLSYTPQSNSKGVFNNKVLLMSAFFCTVVGCWVIHTTGSSTLPSLKYVLMKVSTSSLSSVYCKEFTYPCLGLFNTILNKMLTLNTTNKVSFTEETRFTTPV